MVEFLQSVGPWAPVVILFAAYAETAAFLGLIVPGETLMIAGGAAAAIGGVPLGLVIGVAIVGAALGDATGYYLGRRYGASLLERPRLQRFSDPVEKAGDFLDRHGWWALVLARFLSMFRAVVPFAAGAAQMPYARFAVGNIAGSVLYGGVISGFGFWAGSRWERIENVIRQGGLTLGLLVGMLALISLGTRWVARHRTEVERAFATWRRLPVLGALLGLGVTRSGRARPFLALLPPVGLGVALIIGFAIAGLIDWSFVEASVVRRIQDVDPAVVTVAAAVRDAATHPVVIAALAVAGAVQARLVGWRAVTLVACSTLGTLLIAIAFNDQIDRPFGPVDIELALDPNFPDAVMAVGTAILFSLTWPWKSDWTAGTIRVGAATAVVAALATARAVTVAAYPVDVIAAVCLGTAATIAAGLVFDRRLRNKMRTEPHARGVGVETPAAAAPAHERPAI